MSRPRFPLAVLLSLSLAACSSSGTVDAGTPDTGTNDAGPADATTDSGHDAGADMRPPDPPVVPDSYCPGTSCPGTGDGVLRVGAAKAEITATIGETITVDTNHDGHLDPGLGDTFDDLNGDGHFDGTWIAGYGMGRAANGIKNPQWARAIALQWNGITIVLVALDVVGYFKNDMDEIRQYAHDLGTDVSYISVSSTHVHEARDTIGIWGPSLSETGVDPAYNEHVNHQAAQAVHDAVAAIRPSHVQYATFRTRDQPGGQLRYIGDARDPLVIHDEFRIMRFIDAADGTTTIATMINGTGHPEVSGSDYTLLSSDWPNWLRDGVESGGVALDGVTPVPGVGGIAVFFQGDCGVQIGPGPTSPEDYPPPDGGAPAMLPNRSERTAIVLGQKLAYFALTALGPTGGSVTDDTAALGFRNYAFLLEVQNTEYHLAINEMLFRARMAYDYDPDSPASPRNMPWLQTEIAVLDIGRAQLITMPGELDPALFLGGYDGSYTPAGHPVVDTTRTNPPDLTRAPGPPYIRDLARHDADYVYLLGLTEDFLGYFVLPFDYQLDRGAPYFMEAPGSHYEETNSAGPDAWPRISDKVTQLLAWTPDGGVPDAGP